MGDSQGTRTTFQTFVSLVQALVWPAIVIIMMIVLRTPVTSLVNRTNITKATLPGGAEFTFAAVIVQSGRQEIAAQVAPLPVTPIERGNKGIPRSDPGLD